MCVFSCSCCFVLCVLIVFYINSTELSSIYYYNCALNSKYFCCIVQTRYYHTILYCNKSHKLVIFAGNKIKIVYIFNNHVIHNKILKQSKCKSCMGQHHSNIIEQSNICHKNHLNYFPPLTDRVKSCEPTKQRPRWRAAKPSVKTKA